MWLRLLLVLTVVFSASHGDPVVSNRRFMRRDDVHQPTNSRPSPGAAPRTVEDEQQVKEMRYNRAKQRLDDATVSFQRFSSIVAMAAEASEDPSANQLRGDLPLGHDPIDRIEALERRVQSLEFRGADLQIISEKLLAEFEKKNRLAMESLERENQEQRWQEEQRQKEEEENERLRNEAESHREQLRRQYAQHRSGSVEEDVVAQPAWQLYALYAVILLGFACAVWVLWMVAASWCARKPAASRKQMPAPAPAPNAAVTPRQAFGTPPPPPAPAPPPPRGAGPQQQQQFYNPGFEGELRNRALSRWDQ